MDIGKAANIDGVGPVFSTRWSRHSHNTSRKSISILGRIKNK